MAIANKNSTKKKCRGIGFIIFALIFLATLGLLLIGAWYFGNQKYQKWRTSFENNHLSSDYIEVDSDLYREADESLQDKLVEFQASEEQIDFVELTEAEFVVLFNKVLKESLGKDFVARRYLVDSGDGQWVIYAQVLYKSNILPWVVTTVDKDPIETPEIFVSDIAFGDISLRSIMLGGYIRQINEGYSTSINNINESGFTGRRWQNIELEEDKVIIKGELY